MTRRSTLPQVAKDSYLDSSDIIAKLSEVASAAAAAGGPPFDGSKVCLSAVMADIVFKKMAAHARRSEGEVVAIEEIARACEGKMAEFYELKTATGTEIKRGSIKAIKVVVESLQGGRKHMTHVQNIDAWGIDPEVARSELQVLAQRGLRCVFLPLFPLVIVVSCLVQRLCASACTVQPLPGDHGKELQIQGTFDTQVAFQSNSRNSPGLLRIHPCTGHRVFDQDVRNRSQIHREKVEVAVGAGQRDDSRGRQ
jgi:translation initiation factor 1 (eIF-1/SUI1)